jgi:hypothetical protein
MISSLWGQILHFYSAGPAMPFFVSFVEKKLHRLLQGGIMALVNVSEVTPISLKYHLELVFSISLKTCKKVMMQTNKFGLNNEHVFFT